LSTEKEALENELITIKKDNTDLAIQSSKSKAEKAHIEQVYQDALKLEHENEKLIQESLQLKAELQLAENNTQIQKDTSSRNWFIVGAIVLFFGMIIGFILPGLLNRRRY
jgi:SH3 domain protein